MAYTITKSNGTVLATIADQTFDTTSTALTLVGRGSVNYGPAFDENFVYLMENFANGVPPSAPLVGQLWFDTSTGLMKVFTSASTWAAFANVGGLGNTVGMRQGTTLAGQVSGGNRIAGSTGFALTSPLTGNATTVCLTFSEGKVISIASAEPISYAMLPPSIVLEGFTFQIASRFPNGLKAGVTLATDPAGYVNDGVATSALYAS